MQNSNTMKYDTIIFDMDGVLFDTEAFYFERRMAFFKSKGIKVDHLTPTLFVGGRVGQVWEKVLGEDIAHWDVEALAAAYAQHKVNNPTPYLDWIFPDTKGILEQLHQAGVRLGLASNSSRADITRALETSGLIAYFDCILSGDDCQAEKPSPEIYEKACEQLHCHKERTLVVEDSSRGIEAGKAAELTVWAVKDTRYGMDQSAADRQIMNLTELANLVLSKK